MKHFLVGCSLLSALVAAEPLPKPDAVTAAMIKAARFNMEKLAVQGGYASAWKADLSAGLTEHGESPTIISIQPPGTTTVGLALLRAYQATGESLFLQGARAAGQALIDCQLSSGGWSSDFDFAPDQAKKYHLHRQVLAGDLEKGRRRNTSTLDDNKTQSALLLLLELAHQPECRGDKALQEALNFGLSRLLAAQFPNGAWPQQFDGPADREAPVVPARYPETWSRIWPQVKYAGCYTLNDNNMEECVSLLLRAHALTGEKRWLDAAKRAGDFFILAQMPEPQPVWAQQYNRDMEPVWARKFEPPSVTASESLGVMKSLHALYLTTGDDKYLQPLPAALAWYERSRLPDGRYARFYELRSNRPLYFVKDTYQLTENDDNLPTHYTFKLDVADELARFRDDLSQSRERLLAKRAEPADDAAWARRAHRLVPKVKTALQSQNAEGIWLKKGQPDAGEWCRHMMALAAYVEAARKGGEVFLKLPATR